MTKIKIFLLLLNLYSCFAESFIYIFADLHADINRFKNILINENIIDPYNNWIAQPNTTIIQLGDQIDPKEADIFDINDHHHFRMIYFTENLKKMANDNGCEFISLVGNHELYNIHKIKNKHLLQSIIANRPIIYKKDEYIFCHGGFKLYHYYLLNIYNKTIDDINLIWFKYVYDMPLKYDENIILHKLIIDPENSILFTRTVDKKDDVYKLFNILHISNIFVGHTEVTSLTIKNNVWFLDLFLKDAFDNINYNYILIDNDNIIIKHL